MSRRLDFGDYHVGSFCGERIFSLRAWTRNKFFDRKSKYTGFSIGPILFWKEKI